MKIGSRPTAAKPGLRPATAAGRWWFFAFAKRGKAEGAGSWFRS
jgi:hypothetical protein